MLLRVAPDQNAAPSTRAGRLSIATATRALGDAPPPCIARLRSRRPLQGLPYGPSNTCPVDTFLTLMLHALGADERRHLSRSQTTSATRPAPIRALLAALSAQRRGEPSLAKRLWYEHLSIEHRHHTVQHRPATRDSGKRRSAAQPPSLLCRCACACFACQTGRCPSCSSCTCNEPYRIGHVFGVAEQFFGGLLPSGSPVSPFHFRTRPRWRCDALGCDYEYTGSSDTDHLPLLLGASDVSLLLSDGVRAEVGALTAAHFAHNRYDYGTCPLCGRGSLRSRPTQPRYSPLLLVELGRDTDGAGAAGGPPARRLPWRLDVAPSMRICIDGSRVDYDVAAVVYSDGSHFWADMTSGAHFRRKKAAAARRRHAPPLARASYRYDGLEAGGKLRFSGLGHLVVTSDPALMSLVLYRATRPIQKT